MELLVFKARLVLKVNKEFKVILDQMVLLDLLDQMEIPDIQAYKVPLVLLA
jgi:hypothetical protein